MLAQEGTVQHSNADGHRCINSVLAEVLTKGQGEAILPMECAKLQELKKNRKSNQHGVNHVVKRKD